MSRSKIHPYGKKSLIFLLIPFLVFVLSACGDQDSDSIESVTVTVGTSSLVADGVSETLVRATVLDRDGNPARGITVDFTTTAGSLRKSQQKTNNDGISETRLRSAENIGTATIYATAGGFVATAEVDFVAGPPQSEKITLKAMPSKVSPGGTSTLTVRVEDSNSNPISGETVIFDIEENRSEGSLSTASAATDINGEAAITYTAGGEIGTDTIRAWSSTDSSVAGVVKIDVGLLDFDTITMLIDVSRRVLDATGSDRSEIKVLLRDVNHNPIQDAVVNFSTNLGTITRNAITDSEGYAYVEGTGDYPVLTSDRQNGISTVRAWFGNRENPYAQAETDVLFSGITLTVSADQEYFTTAEAATIEARLRGPANNPMVDQEIVLETDLGEFSPVNGGTVNEDGTRFATRTDAFGNVSVELTSSSGGTARVTGWHAPTKGRPGETTDAQNVYFTGTKLTITPLEDTLVANGSSSTEVSLVLEDEDGNPISDQEIALSSTLGTIAYEVITDEQGKASATLTAGTLIGVARLTATVDLTDEVVTAGSDVSFISGVVSDVSIISDPLIIRKDTGVSELRVMVRDPEGNPVRGVNVAFKIVAGPGGGEAITPATVRTTGSESGAPGQAVARFHAGSLGSTNINDVIIEASVGNIVASTSLTITSNASNISLGASTGRSDIIENNDGSYSIPVAAVVSDINGIAVSAGVEVVFSVSNAELGTIIGPVETDAQGRASTLLTYPSTKAGSNIIIVASTQGISEQVTIRLPGFEDKVLSSIELYDIPNVVLGDGISGGRISARSYDSEGEWVSAGLVFDNNRANDFSAEAAGLFRNYQDNVSISYVDFVPFPASNENADPNDGFVSYDYDAFIKASSGIIESDVQKITVKGVTLSLFPGSDILLANGSSRTTVTAVLSETTTGMPIAGKELNFGVTNGVIEGSATTDGSGTARVTFTSVASEMEKIASVRCYFGPEIMASTEIQLIPFDSATVNILASTDKTRLDNDPNQTAIITAQVLRPDGTPVTDGQLVRFEIISGPGQVDARSNTANGIATATFRATPEIGKAIVRVSSGGQSTTIEIEVGGTASSVIIGSLSLTASNTELVANGVSNAAMRATVMDIDGNPVVGREVNFSTSYGVLSSAIATTDSNGTAEVILTSETRTGLALVMASIPTDAFSDQAQVRFVPGPPVNANSSISVQPSTIEADGVSEAEVTVTLADENGNPVLNGTNVELYASLGTITSSNPAPTDSGRVTFTIQAPLNTGTAELSLWDYPNIDSAELRFGTITSGDPSSILIESVSEKEIAVTGVGKKDNTTISVRVVDETNTTVVRPDMSLEIRLLARPNGGEYISGEDPDGNLVTDGEIIQVGAASGEATFNLRSGFLPGVVEVEIEVIENGVTLTPQVKTVAPQISIASGPPHTMVLSAPTRNAVVNLNDGGDSGIPQTPGAYSRKAGLIVTDRYGNAVPDGTTINLGVIDSIISTGLGDTEEASDILEDDIADFQNDEIVRDDLPRRIEPDDRVVLFDVVARDKSRFINQGGIGTNTLQVNKDYSEENNDVTYYVGASLLGGLIYGIDEDGATKGTVQTVNGLAQIRLVYPANKNRILVGCYGDPTRDERHGQIPGTALSSARVITIFSSSDDRVSMVDRGTLCFSGIAPASLTAVPEEASLQVDETATITLTLVDGGDDIPLPFIPITATVVRDGADVDVQTGDTNEDGQFVSEITLTTGVAGGSATITFYGLGASVEVEVEVQ